MKFFGLVRATFVGVGLLAAGLAVSAQTKVTQVTTAKAVAPQTVVTRISSSSASGAHSTQVMVRHKTAPAATQKAPARAKAIAHAGKIHSNITGPPTVVNSVNFGSTQVAGTPVTMTLTYPATPAASIQPAVSTTVPNGGVAPGAASDYIFFGNNNVEFGGQGGGQPTNLTNF